MGLEFPECLEVPEARLPPAVQVVADLLRQNHLSYRSLGAEEAKATSDRRLPKVVTKSSGL